MQREIEALDALLHSPPRPFVAVLGGAKVTDKIGVVEHLLEHADTVLLGGAMSLPFLSAHGHTLGAGTVGEHEQAAAKRLLEIAAQASCALELPDDLVIARERTADAEWRTVSDLTVPAGWMVLDIGPRSAARFAAAISEAGSVFWNGPMGVFELKPFANGTIAVAEALADAPGLTVAGGGETVQALHDYGLEQRISHVSTGGGATLELLQGHSLPGVLALQE